MFIKRHIILILAAAAAFNSFVSCGQSDGTPDESTAVGDGIKSSATVTEPPVFKPYDLEGDEFIFLTCNSDAAEYVDDYIWADSSDGSAVSKAVVQRNSAVEKEYNVSIIADTVYIPKNEATSRIHSGQIDFDVLYESGTRTSTLALDGLLHDFGDLKSVDLGRSYWIPGAREDLTVGGRMYIATNYITMNSLGWTDFIYFNETMYGELGNTESLYSLVDEGEWTFDRYIGLAVSASKDLDGNGIMTSADRYGIWGDATECMVGLAQSAGIMNTNKQPDGNYFLSVYDETVVDIYTNFRHMLDGTGIFISYDQIWGEYPDLSAFDSRYEGARYLGFGEGHVLFIRGTSDLTGEFSGMDDGYGILPNPLLSSEQEQYYHFVNTDSPMFSIPAYSPSPEITGMVLEYMAYESEKLLLPAFIATVIGSGDSEDARMLEIVRNSVRYEWTNLYGLTVTNSILEKMMSSGSFKTVYSRLASKAKAEVNGCVTSLAFMGLNK